ncbi:hypothetical protein K2P56_02525 [Patescibacteria group bacterium]|nr:hypothetical protein [Patescibacteria group bacterium]
MQKSEALTVEGVRGRFDELEWRFPAVNFLRNNEVPIQFASYIPAAAPLFIGILTRSPELAVSSVLGSVPISYGICLGASKLANWLERKTLADYAQLYRIVDVMSEDSAREVVLKDVTPRATPTTGLVSRTGRVD